MIAELADTMRSLSSLMREETDRLRTFRGITDVAEIAAAKIRLTAALEAQIAQLEREQPGWQEAAEAEDRTALTEAAAELKFASAENADILQRQIELSVDMMDAIAAEAKRLSGTRRQVYGASGGVTRSDLATPISINTSL